MDVKNKIYITITLFSAAALTLIALLVYPTFKDIKNISGEILLKRVEASSMDFQNRALDNFKKKYKEYGSNLVKINQSFVDIKNPVDFIEFLEKTATESDI
ncbi:MAG: hypothetical protein EXS52_00830 [Candidatus Staskawiczbacteria bacterium]|nr:hypothetical protein [Candidatus Staskawiczbacteria bacterium]